MWLFIREQKLLTALLSLSVLVLIAGLLMIQFNTPESAAPTAAPVTEPIADVSSQLSAMTMIAQVAEQQLNEEKTVVMPAAGVGDIKPQESLERVAALNGRVPEVGSDDWCEVMMVKDANAWTLEEKQLFAQHCL